MAARDQNRRVLPRRCTSIPYRTTDAEPTFFNLSDPGASVPSPHGRTFPTALDPLYANRYEVGAFAREAAEIGINYLGVCCGASPMLIRQVAEAVGRTTEASQFSEKMQNHFMYGDNERLPDTSWHSATGPDPEDCLEVPPRCSSRRAAGRAAGHDEGAGERGHRFGGDHPLVADDG